MQLNIIVVLNKHERTGTELPLHSDTSPTFGDKSPSFLVQQPGDDVDLFCEASGAPEPEVTWFKDGVPLVQSDKVTLYKDRILVRAVEASDGGVYECRFKNDFGQISHLIRLLVQELGLVMNSNKINVSFVCILK
ncbi:hypothetical protein HELRODRAFT_168196 [Helobdella robusta]|uniref:Ig-like domain-containing protein n=1 Tax=Helobdella robusta TaxID=6412 RepID=T1F0A5_HELRO|nr:hypothetical protein HELRODRAFT_168196 [Helobdella robusta]ESO09234.1 hypothetical protein HELRODRAFT_168196 [Helobdella robusta]